MGRRKRIQSAVFVIIGALDVLVLQTENVLNASWGISWILGLRIANLVMIGVLSVPQTTITMFVLDVVQVIISISKTPDTHVLIVAKIPI